MVYARKLAAPGLGTPLSVQFGHGLNDLKAWDSKVQGPGWLGALGNGERVLGSRGLGLGAWSHGLGVQGLWGRGQEARSWLGVGHGGLK